MRANSNRLPLITRVWRWTRSPGYPPGTLRIRYVSTSARLLIWKGTVISSLCVTFTSADERLALAADPLAPEVGPVAGLSSVRPAGAGQAAARGGLDVRVGLLEEALDGGLTLHQDQLGARGLGLGLLDGVVLGLAQAAEDGAGEPGEPALAVGGHALAVLRPGLGHAVHGLDLERGEQDLDALQRRLVGVDLDSAVPLAGLVVGAGPVHVACTEGVADGEQQGRAVGHVLALDVDGAVRQLVSLGVGLGEHGLLDPVLGHQLGGLGEVDLGLFG